MIIERPLSRKSLVECKNWILLYGRRKTGKSYLVENFIPHDDYFFVKNDRTIVQKKTSQSLTYEAFLALLHRDIEDGKTAVIDEFHRLGEDFLQELHLAKKSGKLILISSTLHLSKKLVDKNSALLGLVAEFPLGLISLSDTLAALENSALTPKARMELAILLREPLAVDYFTEKKPAREQFAQVLIGSLRTIPALVGEVFSEEERTLSAVYEGVLRAIANGHCNSGEISSYLFARKLIAKDDPSLLSQYLKNLQDFGLIRRIRIFNKSKFIYKHNSPLVRIFYYADEKYNVSERQVGENEVGRIVDELLPHLVEDEVRLYASEKLGLEESVVQGADYDVDACLLRFDKPQMSMEVKWKSNVDREDFKKAEKNLDKVDTKKRILFVPDKTGLKAPAGLKVMDVSDLAGWK